MSLTTRTYSELRRLETFDERFDYLSLNGMVGDITFGFDRYMNQQFYTSREWKQVRQHVIARDNGCDLGIEGFEVFAKLVIHHMNPMSVDDIRHGNEAILEPEFLITTCHKTHNAIHYGDKSQLFRGVTERTAGDTKLW
jgi:hypothetical protein